MSIAPLAWYWPLLGGLMIGIAAGGYLVLTGRIAGISGMLANLGTNSGAAKRHHSALFLAGVLIGGGAALTWHPVPLPALTEQTWPSVVVAGLLVGFGTRLGSGCTSGHGICGLSRLSPRSIAATALFMAAGMLTVGIVRHLLGMSP
ncbi:YeeE/YedE family protein [Stenotrophomonas maltophilia]|uniref:Uncharacterized protein n=1 Tax=Stenotrophomonas maltophilia TaxID=40324 RepID=A0A246IDC9_STEMA|nr:YeeE/YedE family protein [Stenotrophomonas maltophilia]OWQ78033.1 hypothetical protein CEE63_03215 [Stenotrophomonas maltophilia]